MKTAKEILLKNLSLGHEEIEVSFHPEDIRLMVQAMEEYRSQQGEDTLVSKAPESDKGEVDYKAKYEKCIAVIKRFDPGIIGLYDL